MKQHGESPEDRDDSFKYEENFLKDEINLVRDEDEEIITTQHRAEADPTVKTLRPTQQQLSMLDFFRPFLSQNEMTATMECLENEWAELVQKGELDDERIGPIPEVYTEIQSLTRELKKAVREKEELGPLREEVLTNRLQRATQSDTTGGEKASATCLIRWKFYRKGSSGIKNEKYNICC
ncbi:PREDICTED: sperm-associated antigen 16 protein-like isoform X2 [Cyprinodon variegatus]|uniref:sperm-associated antigen 16 protein-like isoform X2 n=1 Tax=Cyprinodon variegatus TaxID=28743 RepID=UPI00074273AF|nr:PREDICTED: sperm-associated antigen 16 protein-like isoform X2 [Cyprinodon variegatus]